jgi:hypothetical protein
MTVRQWLVFILVLVLGIALVFFESDYLVYLDDKGDDIHLPFHEYAGEPQESIEGIVAYRAEIDPLNLLSTCLFVCAIIHTFFARIIRNYAKQKEAENGNVKTFYTELIYFFGEIEIVFGLWAIPLVAIITFLYSWENAVEYLNSLDYREVLIMAVIIILTSSYPLISLIERGLRYIVNLAGGSPAAWWFVLLTLGPLLGSFITEPGAMTVTALLLAKQIYPLKITPRLAYGTIGLLLTNISVGGLLTTFAAPPILVVSHAWHWDTFFMLKTFAWKSILGIGLATLLYFFYFRQELLQLKYGPNTIKAEETDFNEPVPFWVSVVTLLFLIAILANLHEPVILIGIFMIYLGFHQATAMHQAPIQMRSPLLIGFFFAGLIIHSSLQEWWIGPLLKYVSPDPLMFLAFAISPLNDNAVIAYLATFIPNLNDASKYAIIAGSLAAGGMTFLANAPNLIGQEILDSYFPKGIAVKGLFLAALPAALILFAIFFIFQPN